MSEGFIDCVEENHNDILSREDRIVIKIVHKCVCCDPDNESPNDYVIVNKSTPQGITYKQCIDAMIIFGIRIQCNHVFLEGFDKINDITFEASFGS
jgi:hypothetical protein